MIKFSKSFILTWLKSEISRYESYTYNEIFDTGKILALKSLIATIEKNEVIVKFSKATLLTYLGNEFLRILKTEKFDPNNGTAQLRGENKDRYVNYGYWRMLEYIIDTISNGHY